MCARGPSYNGYPVTAEYLGSNAPDTIASALHAIVNTDSFDGAIEHCVNPSTEITVGPWSKKIELVPEYN